MGMIGEFKQFAMRGNVVDLAVGVVIGAAFGKIVTSLVNNVIMPPIGLLIGRVDFADLAWTLKAASVGTDGKELPAVTLNYGDFINTIVQFVIIAFAVFLVVRGINRLKRKQAEAPPKPAAPSEEVLLLREIRDALKPKHDPVPQIDAGVRFHRALLSSLPISQRSTAWPVLPLPLQSQLPHCLLPLRHGPPRPAGFWTRLWLPR